MNKFLILPIFLFLIFNCYEQENEADFGGYVYDNIDKQPIVGVKVTVKTNSEYTDTNGFFIFRLETPNIPFGATEQYYVSCEFTKIGYKKLSGQLFEGVKDKKFYMIKDNTSDTTNDI